MGGSALLDAGLEHGVEEEDQEGDGGVAEDHWSGLRGEVQAESAGKDEDNKGERAEWGVEAWDFGVDL